MIYFRGHIRALESQIAYLKERIAKLEQENRDLLDARAIAAGSEAQAHIETLKSDIGEARIRANGLFDRVLEKHNIAPVVEPPKSVAIPEVITPFGLAVGDAQEALKESVLREETEFIMGRDGLDEGTARMIAEQWYVGQYRPIK